MVNIPRAADASTMVSTLFVSLETTSELHLTIIVGQHPHQMGVVQPSQKRCHKWTLVVLLLKLLV